jgi:riboflavin synthase
LVAGLGRVAAVERSDDGVRLTVESPLAGELALGDSIAVNGVCLTAVAVAGDSFAAEVMNESLARSSLSDASPGVGVNLELPLRASDRLGGHIMQGHVDGVGTVVEVVPDGFARLVTIGASEEVLRYVVEKGSIAVDGVSLTVAAIDDRSFTVSLIPETLERTNLGTAETGTRVNLEVDVLAKYVEKMVRSTGQESPEGEHRNQIAGLDAPRRNPPR